MYLEIKQPFSGLINTRYIESAAPLPIKDDHTGPFSWIWGLSTAVTSIDSLLFEL